MHLPSHPGRLDTNDKNIGTCPISSIRPLVNSRQAEYIATWQMWLSLSSTDKPGIMTNAYATMPLFNKYIATKGADTRYSCVSIYYLHEIHRRSQRECTATAVRGTLRTLYFANMVDRSAGQSSRPEDSVNYLCLSYVRGPSLG